MTEKRDEREETKHLTDRDLLLRIYHDVSDLRERVSKLEERVRRHDANIEIAFVAAAGALDRTGETRSARALRKLVDRIEAEVSLDE